MSMTSVQSTWNSLCREKLTWIIVTPSTLSKANWLSLSYVDERRWPLFKENLNISNSRESLSLFSLMICWREIHYRLKSFTYEFRRYTKFILDCIGECIRHIGDSSSFIFVRRQNDNVVMVYLKKIIFAFRKEKNLYFCIDSSRNTLSERILEFQRSKCLWWR